MRHVFAKPVLALAAFLALSASSYAAGNPPMAQPQEPGIENQDLNTQGLDAQDLDTQDLDVNMYHVVCYARDRWGNTYSAAHPHAGQAQARAHHLCRRASHGPCWDAGCEYPSRPYYPPRQGD